MTDAPHRRRQYLIKKSFQSSFSLRFIFISVLEAALIVGLFWYLGRSTLTTGYDNSILKVEKTSQFFFMTYIWVGIVVALAMTWVGMVVFIVLSHRIAGPLHHVETHLQKMLRGDVSTRVQLRKKDQLGVLADVTNELTQELDQKWQALRKDIYLLSQHPPASPQAQEALARLKKAADSLKTSQ